MIRPYNEPVSSLSYTENFLYMLDKLSETNYKPHPVLVKALDVLFILHADHELNCGLHKRISNITKGSTATMRHISSAKTDPYTAMAGAAGALYGPLHV
jgi:citrate synthase